MTEATLEFPELSLVDQLIAGLEGLIAESDETPLSIDATQQPKRAVYRIIGAVSPSERKAYVGDAVYLNSEHLILRCSNTEVVRLTPLEITIQAEKSGRGETLAVIKGKVRDLKRIRGGYDIEVDISDMRKTRITPSQKLRECLHRNDAATWNRWCSDIRDNIELMGMDLRSADMSGYDLCCADFTGSDLTGANLTGALLAGADLGHCITENITVTGADFFNSRLSKNQRVLLQLSGMIEVESVVFDQ